MYNFQRNVHPRYLIKKAKECSCVITRVFLWLSRYKVSNKFSISENFQGQSCFLSLEKVFWKFLETFVYYCGFGSDISSADFVTKSAVDVDRENNQTSNVAFALRLSVKSVTTRKLPENMTVENIMEGECAIPDDLFEFISYLVYGPDSRRSKSSDDFFKIKSICCFLMFVINKRQGKTLETSCTRVGYKIDR